MLKLLNIERFKENNKNTLAIYHVFIFLGRLICAKKMKSESTTKMETERLWRLLLNFARNKFFSDSVDIKGMYTIYGLIIGR